MHRNELDRDDEGGGLGMFAVAAAAMLLGWLVVGSGVFTNAVPDVSTKLANLLADSSPPSKRPPRETAAADPSTVTPVPMPMPRHSL